MEELSETDRIERDLAATRARMDGRLDELQDHLTPKQMLNDAFAYFRGGEGADFTNDLIVRARANPLPVALTGIGIAWLMASSTRSASPPVRSPRMEVRPDQDLDARIRQAEGRVQRFEHDDDDSYSGRLEDARGKVLGLTRNASDTATSYRQRIKDAMASAAQSIRETSHDLTAIAGDTVHQTGGRVRAHTDQLQEGTTTMVRSTRDAFSSVVSNPFALGAAAALVGIVAGALIPTFDEEEHALGSVATKLRTTGRDLAQDVVDRGARVATDTIGAVKGSAEAHGLTADKPIGEIIGDAKSGALADHIKGVAQETLQASKGSAQTNIAGASRNGE